MKMTFQRAGLALATLFAAACAAGSGDDPAPSEAERERGAALEDEPPVAFVCGGLIGGACPGSGSTRTKSWKLACVDDWRDDCDVDHGDADCPGLCRPVAVQLCGGANDPPCGAGLVCIGDPSLDCAPPDDSEPTCSIGVCVLAAAQD